MGPTLDVIDDRYLWDKEIASPPMNLELASPSILSLLLFLLLQRRSPDSTLNWNISWNWFENECFATSVEFSYNDWTSVMTIIIKYRSLKGTGRSKYVNAKFSWKRLSCISSFSRNKGTSDINDDKHTEKKGKLKRKKERRVWNTYTTAKCFIDVPSR